MLIILVLVLTMLCIYLWYDHRKKQAKVPTTEKVSFDYSCEDGHFHVEGDKNCFQITKNDRFSFIVKNGEISSFVDKTVGDPPICYRGDENGN